VGGERTRECVGVFRQGTYRSSWHNGGLTWLWDALPHTAELSRLGGRRQTRFAPSALARSMCVAEWLLATIAGELCFPYNVGELGASKIAPGGGPQHVVQAGTQARISSVLLHKLTPARPPTTVSSAHRHTISLTIPFPPPPPPTQLVTPLSPAEMKLFLPFILLSVWAATATAELLPE
jgi:hypothetical protein